MLLAWFALGSFGCTQYTRYTRGAMVEVLERGLHPHRQGQGPAGANQVVYKHGLRAALVPVVTIFGIDFGTLLAGTIFTERIFDIQGIGCGACRRSSSETCPSWPPPRCSARPC